MKPNVAFQSLLFFVLLSNGGSCKYLFPAPGASRNTITVVNDCGFTVWPGIYSNPLPSITGFELTAGNSRSFETPENWSGMLWGRTGCTFNGSGHGSCNTGDCGSGEIECNGGSATPPVTIAQFEIHKEYSEVDVSYDASLMDGYNLPITVEPIDLSPCLLYGCPKRGCSSDLNKRCPKELMLKGGGGCHTPCQAFGTPKYCFNKTCEPASYSRLFTSACPRSDSLSKPYGIRHVACHSYNYTVRFCPPKGAFSTMKVGSQLDINDQLVSICGNFKLAIIDNSDKFYVGIWYTDDAEQRKVWVANPKAPFVSRSTVVLSIDPNTGNLIFTDADMLARTGS